jgi:putative resolvase
MFLLSELETFLGVSLREHPEKKTPTVLVYGRVSSRRQAGEGDLDRQMSRLSVWAEQTRPSSQVEEFSDVASGLSDRRPGLRRALERCRSSEVDELVVTHWERLARFGTGLMATLLDGQGVRVTVIGEDEAISGSAESELVRDMLAVVTSFSGRLYGQRSARARSLRACVSKAVT